jgi:hypothetical protein
MRVIAVIEERPGRMTEPASLLVYRTTMGGRRSIRPHGSAAARCCDFYLYGTGERKQRLENAR